MGLYLVNYTLKYSLMGLNGTYLVNYTLKFSLMGLNETIPGKLHTEVQFDGTKWDYTW